MIEPETITLLWQALASIFFTMIWLVPIMWIGSVIEALTMNELLPLAIAWAVGLGSKDKEYIRGKVKMYWDDISAVVSYLKKVLYFFCFIFLFLRLGDAVWAILEV